MKPATSRSRPSQPTRIHSPQRSHHARVAVVSLRSSPCSPSRRLATTRRKTPLAKRPLRHHYRHSKNAFRAWAARSASPNRQTSARPRRRRPQGMEKLPNVIEVYPQIRFFTEVRFNNKPFATVVAGMPDSLETPVPSTACKATSSLPPPPTKPFCKSNCERPLRQACFPHRPGTSPPLRRAPIFPSAATNADPSANIKTPPAAFPLSPRNSVSKSSALSNRTRRRLRRLWQRTPPHALATAPHFAPHRSTTSATSSRLQRRKPPTLPLRPRQISSQVDALETSIKKWASTPSLSSTPQNPPHLFHGLR